MSADLLRDADTMLRTSTNAAVILTSKDGGGGGSDGGEMTAKPVSLKRKESAGGDTRRTVSLQPRKKIMLKQPEKVETIKKPVSLTQKESVTTNTKRSSVDTQNNSNNNILLLSRSDTDIGGDNVKKSVLFNSVSKSVILSHNSTVRKDNIKLQQANTTPKLNISPKPAVTPSPSQHIVDIDHVTVKTENISSEPINLSLKSSIPDNPVFETNTPRQTFSSHVSSRSFITPSEKLLSHSVSITPIVKLDSHDTQETPDKDPLALDDEDDESRNAIDDDEDSYLQQFDDAIGGIVEVKLECPNYEDESKMSYSCPKCNRSYATKHLCELHMKKDHFYSTKKKEKCDICGVRFINLRAHKEKYHYFVDVDKCNLCGKVRY